MYGTDRRCQEVTGVGRPLPGRLSSDLRSWPAACLWCSHLGDGGQTNTRQWLFLTQQRAGEINECYSQSITVRNRWVCLTSWRTLSSTLRYGHYARHRGLEMLSPGGLALTKTGSLSTVFVAWDGRASEQSLWFIGARSQAGIFQSSSSQTDQDIWYSILWGGVYRYLLKGDIPLPGSLTPALLEMAFIGKPALWSHLLFDLSKSLQYSIKLGGQ